MKTISRKVQVLAVGLALLLGACNSVSFVPADSLAIARVAWKGNRCFVEGDYVLGSRDEAMLCLYLTADSDLPEVGPFGNRTMRVTRGSGHFQLDTFVDQPGRLHVSFYPVSGGGPFFGRYLDD